MKQQTTRKTGCDTLFWKMICTPGLFSLPSSLLRTLQRLWSSYYKHSSFWAVHKAIDMGSFTTSTIWYYIKKKKE
jgi:hypothetical protein